MITGRERDLRTAFEARGVTVLQNEAAVIPTAAAEESLYVVGLGPARMNVVDVEEAFAGVPDAAPGLVLLHNP